MYLKSLFNCFKILFKKGNTLNSNLIEFFITSEQQRIMNELLPKGYSLQFASKPARSKSGSFTSAAAFARQNDGQLRNSNGQFASNMKTPKNAKFGSGKLSSQENYGVPQYPFSQSNNNMMNQGGYAQIHETGSNPGNNGMMKPQMMGQVNSMQNQQQYSQQQMNMQGMPMQQQKASASPQQSQSSIQIPPSQSSQQQIPQHMQSHQYQQGMMMYGGQAGGDLYQQQQMQPPYQMQMPQQMHMHQMKQQPMYQQQIMHMKPTGAVRKNSTAKPSKDKKNKLAEKALKLKRKNEKQLIPKPTKKQQAANAVAAMMMGQGMMSEQLKKCIHILHSLQKHKSAFPFSQPVDPVSLGCPDYYQVIRDPMDLSTIERNLKSHLYQSPTQFAADVRKIWNNSYIYNNRDSQIYNMTLEMDKYFEKKFKEMEYGKAKSDHSTFEIIELIQTAIKGNKQTNVATPKGNMSAQPSKKQKNLPSKMDIPMTMQEKKNLGQNILQLPPESLPGVWEIVQSDGNQQYDDKVLTFDIDALSVRKTRELEQYVKKTLANANKKQSKKQAKIQEKSSNAENKLSQQTYCQEDETAATHQETCMVQYFNPDMTQSTIPHSQQYQVPMHPSQYPTEQMHTQTIGQNGQNEYNQNKHHNEANGMADNNQGQNEDNDDSESSFVSDSDSYH